MLEPPNSLVPILRRTDVPLDRGSKDKQVTLLQANQYFQLASAHLEDAEAGSWFSQISPQGMHAYRRHRHRQRRLMR